MHPLINLWGNIRIPANSFMVVGGLVVYILGATYHLRKLNIDGRGIVLLSVPLLLVAGKLAYFAAEGNAVISVYRGYSMSGGYLMTGIILYLFLARRGDLQTFNILLAWLTAYVVLARVGCLLAGCCHGCPTEAPWGMSFTRESVAFHVLHTKHIVSLAFDKTPPLFPTQLLYVAIPLLGLAVLTKLRRKGITSDKS